MPALSNRTAAIVVALILSTALLAFGAEHRYTVSHMGRGYIIRTDRLTGRSQACELDDVSPPQVQCGDAR